MNNILYKWRLRLRDAIESGLGIPGYHATNRHVRDALHAILGAHDEHEGPVVVLAALSESIGTLQGLDRRYTAGKRKPGFVLARKWLIEEIEAAL